MCFVFIHCIVFASRLDKRDSKISQANYPSCTTVRQLFLKSVTYTPGDRSHLWQTLLMNTDDFSRGSPIYICLPSGIGTGSVPSFRLLYLVDNCQMYVCTEPIYTTANATYRRFQATVRIHRKYFTCHKCTMSHDIRLDAIERRPQQVCRNIFLKTDNEQADVTDRQAISHARTSQCEREVTDGIP